MAFENKYPFHDRSACLLDPPGLETTHDLVVHTFGVNRTSIFKELNSKANTLIRLSGLQENFSGMDDSDTEE